MKNSIKAMIIIKTILFSVSFVMIFLIMKFQ